MTYHRTSLGQIPFHQSGGSPVFGGPMPILPPAGVVPGPAMPANIFPTNNLRWGDPVNVTGNFSGLMQGQVRVKFAGAPWQAPAIMGPFSATVQVPEGAQTGECLIEVNGQQVFGSQCSVVPGVSITKPHPVLGVRKNTAAWQNYGDMSRMGDAGQDAPLGRVLMAGGALAGAYHGYKRNHSVGWAVAWAILGGIAPLITTGVALAQGFGKPKGRR